MDTLVSVKDAASRLGCTYAMLRAWIRDSKLSVVKVGSLNRIRQSDLDNWVQHGLYPMVKKSEKSPKKGKGRDKA